MRAELRAGVDGHSVVVSIENDAELPNSVAVPNAHVNVVLRDSEGRVVHQSFGSFIDAPGPWRVVEPGTHADLVVELRKHYAGAIGRFLVECNVPTRDSRGRNELVTVKATVDLSIPSLP